MNSNDAYRLIDAAVSSYDAADDLGRLRFFAHLAFYLAKWSSEQNPNAPIAEIIQHAIQSEQRLKAEDPS